MSSCLSGGYRFDLENIVKSSSSSSTSSRHSNSSSPSSTVSESSNLITAVLTRKPRTPRKRPNQTYTEAATLLSTACPTIFSIHKKTSKQSKLPNQHTHFFSEPPELLLPIPVAEKPVKVKPEIDFNWSPNWSHNSSSLELSEGYQEDFETESMLDEEIGEGIDCIMGKSDSMVENDGIFDVKSEYNNTCYGYPVGLGLWGNLELNFGFGLRNGVRALRNVDEGNWWRFPAVNVMDILPPETKSEKSPIEKKKLESESSIVGEERMSLENRNLLMLKLNYDEVLNAWSDKGSPVPEGMLESSGVDIHAKLAQIDLFSENGGVREASVIRYKEKRRTRFFSKKIRYQVRKINADRRPRSKGRFVRRPNSQTCEET
ncbi:hypothetical protein QVD17_29817 [Tagetes erecta]|uniref:CCT domain-containing protein n=1 Tax=Tagetes erecta TaxID=13708 RepID=A0AAD8NMZ1_TARER|nr:hypothetical protein QVD17_29817 [Tagetes erecta]